MHLHELAKLVNADINVALNTEQLTRYNKRKHARKRFIIETLKEHIISGSSDKVNPFSI